MHRDICLTNREAIVDWLDTLLMQLAEFRSLIADRDERRETYFVQAKDVREGVYR